MCKLCLCYKDIIEIFLLWFHCNAWDPIFVNFVVEQIPKIKLSRIKPTICFGRDICFRIFKIVFITKSTKLMLKNINEITVSLNLMEFLPACWNIKLNRNISTWKILVLCIDSLKVELICYHFFLFFSPTSHLRYGGLWKVSWYITYKILIEYDAAFS